MSFLRRQDPPSPDLPSHPHPTNERHPTGGQREFIVVGLGRFGTSLAKSLVHDRHDVLAIDADYQRVQALSVDLPHVIQIDATSEDALREIGADHFDTGIVCIGTDFESNMLATVLLRRLGVRRIIAKARTRTQREILQLVGADEVILPEHEAGKRLAQRLSAVNFVDYLQLSPEVSVVEMLVPERLHNHTLANANLPQRYGLTVLAIRRQGQFRFNPPDNTVLLAGDEMLVAGSITSAQRLSG
jgi:trk system potassium uptake protein